MLWKKSPLPVPHRWYVIDFHEVYYLWLTREAELVVVKCILCMLSFFLKPNYSNLYINNEGMWAQFHVYSYYPVCGRMKGTVYE